MFQSHIINCTIKLIVKKSIKYYILMNVLVDFGFLLFSLLLSPSVWSTFFHLLCIVCLCVHYAYVRFSLLHAQYICRCCVCHQTLLSQQKILIIGINFNRRLLIFLLVKPRKWRNFFLFTFSRKHFFFHSSYQLWLRSHQFSLFQVERIPK